MRTGDLSNRVFGHLLHPTTNTLLQKTALGGVVLRRRCFCFVGH